MSHSSEAWAEQQELSQQAQESEEELYFAILDALKEAQNLGLDSDRLKTLCYVAGIDFTVLEDY